jgi:hypothetical protein
MRHLWSRGFGRLHSDAEVITTDDGKRFLLAVVEFEKRTLANGKPYAQRVTFRSFDPEDMDCVRMLIEGTHIMFDGDCDALAEKSSSGWWYANPRITGRIHEIIPPHDES